MLPAATTALLSLALAAAPEAAAAGGPAPASAKTLWVVEPLRLLQGSAAKATEEALRRLLPEASDDLVGTGALPEELREGAAKLRCLRAGAKPAKVPPAATGLERVVVLRAAKEGALYRVRAARCAPGAAETASAEGTDADPERALLAALGEVVAFSARLDVVSEPSGAAVLVDGESVGVTPWSGPARPGQRVVRLELPSHMPRTRKLALPLRGGQQVSEALERVPARLVAAAQPAGAAISVDGVDQGTDAVDRPIQPGPHRIDIARDGYLPATETIDVPPDTTFFYEGSLAPTEWTRFKQTLSRNQEAVYARTSSLQLNYEWVEMHGDRLHAKQDPSTDASDPRWVFARKLLARAPLHGFSVEYARDGRYFGLMIAGAGYYTGSRWRYTLEHGRELEGSGTPTLLALRALQPHLRLALWRLAFYAQAGFELRALNLHPAKGSLEGADLWLVDVLTSAQLALRGFLYEGLFLEASYRFSWAIFSEPAGLRGFHVGLGWAF